MRKNKQMEYLTYFGIKDFIEEAKAGASTFFDFTSNIERIARKRFGWRWESALERMGLENTKALKRVWMEGRNENANAKSKVKIAIRPGDQLSYWGRNSAVQCAYCLKPIENNGRCRYIETSSALFLVHEDCWIAHREALQDAFYDEDDSYYLDDLLGAV